MRSRPTILNTSRTGGGATTISGKLFFGWLVVLVLFLGMKPANAQLEGGVNEVAQLEGGVNDAAPLQGGVNSAAPLQGGVNSAAPLQGGVNSAAPLQGGVQHAEKLPPVEKRLQSGSKFDEGYLTNVVPNNMWIPIPSWFAGVWETRTETQLESTDLTGMGSMGMGGMEMMGMDGMGMSGMEDGSSNKPSTFARIDKWVFGMQIDKFGQVWHFVNVPSYRKVQVEDTFEHRQEVSKEFLYVDDARVVTRYRFTAVIADGQSKKIQQARQQETMLIYKAATSDTMRAFGSIKLFSQEGIPLMLSKNFTPFYRLKTFAPIPVYHGMDMRRSFRDYLLSHNLAERMPDDLKHLDDELPKTIP